MPLIKRYSNRKLYDTEARRYVGLEEIAELVREGREVQVVDHRTGADLTDATLAHLVLSQARRRAGSLSRSALLHLVRASGLPRGAWVEQLGRVVEELEEEGQLSAEGAGRLRALAAELGSEDVNLLRVVEHRVQEALRRFSFPTRNEVKELEAELDRLAVQLDRARAQQVESQQRT